MNLEKRHIWLVRKIRTNDYFATFRVEYGWFESEEDCEKFCAEIKKIADDEGDTEYEFKPYMVCCAAQYMPDPEPLTDTDRAKIRREIFKRQKKLT